MPGTMRRDASKVLSLSDNLCYRVYSFGGEFFPYHINNKGCSEEKGKAQADHRAFSGFGEKQGGKEKAGAKTKSRGKERRRSLAEKGEGRSPDLYCLACIKGKALG